MQKGSTNHKECLNPKSRLNVITKTQRVANSSLMELKGLNCPVRHNQRRTLVVLLKECMLWSKATIQQTCTKSTEVKKKERERESAPNRKQDCAQNAL